MVYVYQCPQFKEDLKNYICLQENIENSIQKLQSERTPESARQILKNLRNTNLYKDNIGGNFRMLVQEKEVSLNNRSIFIYCIQRLLSHAEYGPITQTRDTCLNWMSNNLLPEMEIKTWVADQEAQKGILLTLPTIPSIIFGWLYLSDKERPIYDQDAIIYESEDWIKATEKDYFQRGGDASFFHTLLFENILCSGMIEGHQLATNADYGLSILYQKWNIQGRNVYFLYTHFEILPTNTQIQDYIFKYTFNAVVDIDHLARRAKKAYPEYIAYDARPWMKMEVAGAVEANLAFSPEEEEVLRKTNVPLFINGRAGSGKSTMLFYLFAAYCNKKITSERNKRKISDPSTWQEMHSGHPLFLTYSAPLLDVAREIVTQILILNSRYQITKLDEEEKNLITSFFSSFQKFVKKFISSAQNYKFQTKDYISFAKFKHLYQEKCKLPEKKKYSPEFVWHIIRTLIKGYDSENYLTPEKYKHLSKLEKTVDYTSYENVFNTIWTQWYRDDTNPENSQKAGWDDQDLIRFVLQNCQVRELAKDKYPVIFCDEAQDFTQIEFKFLLQVSAFSGYDLSWQSSIPFAFAGDPFQTINPTGFSWARLKAAFFRTIDDLKCREICPVLKELRYNYRSKPGVVNFANLIQYYRYKLLLNQEEVTAQIAWLEEIPLAPSLFILGNNIRPTDIQNVKPITLVSQEPGEIEEYIRKDEFLMALTDKGEKNGETVFYNTFSSAEAKGLEFDNVILYKFGEEGAKWLSQLLESLTSEISLEESFLIGASYFFNKLYVATTRARKEIYIIDSQEGYDKFWKFFQSGEALLNQYPEDIEKWQSKIIYPHLGTHVELRTMFKNPNWKEIAEALRKRGEGQEDPDLLEKSAHYYSLVGYEREYLECQAFALELRKKWEEAGTTYNQLGDMAKTSECFWKGKCWKRLIQLHTKHTQPLYRIRKAAGTFMDSPDSDVVSFLQEMSELQNDMNWPALVEPDDEIWQEIMKQVILKADQILSIPSAPLQGMYISTIDKLGDIGFLELHNAVAHIYFKIAQRSNQSDKAKKDFGRAVEIWETLQQTSSAIYHEAKGYIVDNLDDKIFHLGQAQKYLKIFQNYLGTSQHLSKEASFYTVFIALEKETIENYAEVLAKLIADMSSFPQAVLELEKWWPKCIACFEKYSCQPDFGKIRENLIKALVTSSNGLVQSNSCNLWSRSAELIWGRSVIYRSLLAHTQQYHKELEEKGKGISKEEVSELKNLQEKTAKLNPSVPLFASIDIDNLNFWVIRLIATIANSSLDPERTFSIPQKKFWEEVIIKAVSNVESMNYTQIGAALEKVGALYKTQVSFYSNALSKLQGKAKREQEKWIQKRYLKALRKWNTLDPSQKSLSEMENKQVNWQISDEELEKEPDFAIPLELL